MSAKYCQDTIVIFFCICHSIRVKKFIVIFLALGSFFLLHTSTYAACLDVGSTCGSGGSMGKGGGGIQSPCCNPSKNGKPTLCVKNKCVEAQPKKTCVADIGKKCSNGVSQPDQCCATNPQGQSLFCQGGLSGTCQVVKNCAGKVGDKCSPLAGDKDPQCCNVETGTSNPLLCGPDSKCKSNIKSNPSEPPTIPPPSPPCISFASNGGCSSIKSAFGTLDTEPGKFVAKVFAILLSASGGIALFLIIRAGYTLMTSQGKPEQIQTGRDQLIAAIVGLLFLIFSFVILQVIGTDVLKITK
jgi:hypothetical protein